MVAPESPGGRPKSLCERLADSWRGARRAFGDVFKGERGERVGYTLVGTLLVAGGFLAWLSATEPYGTELANTATLVLSFFAAAVAVLYLVVESKARRLDSEREIANENELVGVAREIFVEIRRVRRALEEGPPTKDDLPSGEGQRKIESP